MTKYSDKAEPHYLRGVKYEQEGRIGDAIREYRMANRIKDDLIPARKRLGDLFLAQGRIDDAIQQFQKAVSITSQKRKWKRTLVPDEDKYSLIQVLERLAEAYRRAGRQAEAEAAWDRLLATAPARPEDRVILERVRRLRGADARQGPA
ncbi:TPR_REGION domain-containing protein [Candidatus Hydrogenisulfobacillus filiaventi]|uniref:TPR_REGION domain-containing protein n=1 Tax=Candidatus Hydrogenisulfobacillus filiaventi TaxID=2707344 RepID=A0A6F8ZEX5_9FIRM|nr:tetratricopeptide repeat protein [Bacillota bacterium]CAB1128327.1 TPR_REGION domain-containing protein [Candidatus Hydrogenisulfobacillus filiaventi]